MAGAVHALLVEAQALSTRLAALNEVSVVMQRSTDSADILHVLASQARWVIDFQLCAIVLNDGNEYRYEVLRSLVRGAPQSPRPHHRAMMEHVMRHGHAVVVHELKPEDDPPPNMRSAILLPLRNRTQPLGVLCFYTTTPNHYTAHDLQIANALGLQVTAVLENARLFADVARARDELRTVLEAIGDGVVVFDVHGRMQLANRAFCAMFHLQPQAVPDRPLPWLLARADAHGERLLDVTTRRKLFQAARQRRANAVLAPDTFRTTDQRHFAWVSTPLCPQGQLSGYVVTVRDVSAQVALDQLRDDMVHMLVHDLRTPLSSVTMGLDLLDLYVQAGDMPSFAETMTAIRRALRHSEDQINTLLDISKLEAGRMTLHFMLLDLAALMQSAAGFVKPQLQHSQQQVSVEMADDLPQIVGDSYLLQRVFNNLLSNACKFTPSGGRIVLGGRMGSDGAHAEVWVQDNGPGVPLPMRERIFEKYRQVHAVEARRGTGLGLAFCRLVVEAHGGEIGVRDAPGGGSVFWVRLPVTQPLAA